MTPRKKTAGFTLIELIVALSLSSIVLVGVFSIMTSMVQYEIEGGRKGSVTAWSLASISAMNRDIANASVIEYPNVGASADSLVLCNNWSRLMSPPNGAMMSALAPAPTVVYYCYDAAANALRKMTVTGNCPNVGAGPPSCDAGTYGSGSVIATSVYRDLSNNIVFTNDAQTTNAIRLRFSVGNPAQGTVAGSGTSASFVNPQSVTFDTKVLMEN